jgi:hypothetical protein
MKAWAGGGQLSVARPPRPRRPLAGGAKPGLSDTRLTTHKNTKHDILPNFKNSHPKLSNWQKF